MFPLESPARARSSPGQPAIEMAAASFEPGSWVWIADEEDLVVPAKVISRFKAGEATRVERANGAVDESDRFVQKSAESTSI